MHYNQNGFTLIIVLTVLAVLSLMALSAFEQSEWVKRSAYVVWQQVKIQDKTWQALNVGEKKLSTRITTQQCFVPYSLSNGYFFLEQKGEGACTESSSDQNIRLMYEVLPEIPCARIQNRPMQEAHFFRVTIQSKNAVFKQRTILQSIFVLATQPFQGKTPIECLKIKQYEAGRQSWILQ